MVIGYVVNENLLLNNIREILMCERKSIIKEARKRAFYAEVFLIPPHFQLLDCLILS